VALGELAGTVGAKNKAGIGTPGQQFWGSDTSKVHWKVNDHEPLDEKTNRTLPGTL